MIKKGFIKAIPRNIYDLERPFPVSFFIPIWDNLPSGYQHYPLKGINLRYMYCGQKHFSE